MTVSHERINTDQYVNYWLAYLRPLIEYASSYPLRVYNVLCAQLFMKAPTVTSLNSIRNNNNDNILADNVYCHNKSICRRMNIH